MFGSELIWQDVVLSVGQLVFAVALVPAIRAKEKPPLITSVMSGLVLATFAVAFATLGLWFSAATVAVVSVLWLVVAYQTLRR